MTVTLIPGDGVTAELVEPVLGVLEAAGARLDWERVEAGAPAQARRGEPLPPALLDSIRRNRVALKGRLLSQPAGPYPAPNLELHRRLDLFALVTPIRNLPGLPARHAGVDILLVRQATEDLYAGLEDRITDQITASLKVVTAAASERIARLAFEQALAAGRRRVTLVHKANIMKVTDGLLIEATRAVAAAYPAIEFDTLIVDNAAMQLVLRPQRFDVLLTTSLYGSILADLGAGITGGISNTLGIARNDELAVFEALHGDVEHLAGAVANPLPLLMPACALLEHLGQPEPAAAIRDAIGQALQRGVRTPDLGGQATTAELCAAIVAALRAGA